MPRQKKIPKGYPIKPFTTPGGAIKYRAIVTWHSDGRKEQVRRRFDTVDQAVEFVDDMRTKIRTGQYEARDNTTLAQLVEAWRRQKDDVRSITMRGYQQVLKALLRDHGQVKVQSINRAMIDRWRKDWPTTGGLRGQGLSKRSIVMTLNVLRQVLDYGVRTGLIKDNPAKGIKPPRESFTAQQQAERRKVTYRIWTPDQLVAFVQAADADPLAAAWRLSCAGLRRSEVLGVDWSGVDLEAATVTISQARSGAEVDDVKAVNSARTLWVEDLIPGTRKALLELWISQGRPTRGLVVVDAAGRPLHRDVYSRRFQAIAREAGLPKIRMHSLRHTLNNQMEQLGVPLVTRAAVLGHSPETNMNVYSLSTEDQTKDAQQRIGRSFAGLAVVEGPGR